MLHRAESQGDTGSLGQYSLRFAASSESTDSLKCHKSEGNQLPSVSGPQTPATYPKDTGACDGGNCRPSNVCPKMRMQCMLRFLSCTEYVTPKKGRAEAAKWCWDCLCACPGNANSSQLGFQGWPGGLAQSLLEGKPQLREQPQDPAAVASPSLTFSLG